jgi:hypothetical protein
LHFRKRRLYLNRQRGVLALPVHVLNGLDRLHSVPPDPTFIPEHRLARRVPLHCSAVLSALADWKMREGQRNAKGCELDDDCARGTERRGGASRRCAPSAKAEAADVGPGAVVRRQAPQELADLRGVGGAGGGDTAGGDTQPEGGGRGVAQQGPLVAVGRYRATLERPNDDPGHAAGNRAELPGRRASALSTTLRIAANCQRASPPRSKEYS